VFGIVVLFVGVLVLPESPKYLYSKQKFKEAKEALETIARMNDIKTYSSLFVFDNELIQEDQLDTIIEKKKQELLDKVAEHPECLSALSLLELKELEDLEEIEEPMRIEIK